MVTPHGTMAPTTVQLRRGLPEEALAARGFESRLDLMQIRINRKIGEAVIIPPGIYCRLTRIGRSTVTLEFTVPDGTRIIRVGEEEAEEAEEAEEPEEGERITNNTLGEPQ